MSVLGLRCPPEFRAQFVQYVEKSVEVASRAAIDKRRLDTMQDLVTYLRSLPESNVDHAGDPRFFALWHCAVNSGQPISDTPFAPGRNVQTVIANLGEWGSDLVGSDASFSEIVVAAFLDTLEYRSGLVGQAQAEAAQAVKECARFAQLEPDLAETRERLNLALTDNDRLTAELRELEEVTRFLKASAEGKPKSKAKAA